MLTKLPIYPLNWWIRANHTWFKAIRKVRDSLGRAINHMGLDDAVMIKDNHIAAAGSIGMAITCIRHQIRYPLTIEVETETLDQVEEALAAELSCWITCRST